MSSLLQKSKKPEPAKTEAEEKHEEAQIQKLKTWTEKPFPIELKSDSKSPFLHQFSESQLKEGLIHAVTTRRTLEDELEKLFQIYEDQYQAVPKHKQTFKQLIDQIEKDLSVEYDEEAMLSEIDEEDFEMEIREWFDGYGFEEGRMLRYTVCVVSRKNDRVREHIRGFRRSIGQAQGDI